MYYIVSVANLATNPGSTSWTASQFGAAQTTLNGVGLGRYDSCWYYSFLANPFS